MRWKTNTVIPLPDKTQAALGVVLSNAAGLDPEKVGESGEMVGYMPPETLGKVVAHKRLGTTCGAAGNLFSEAMVALLLQAEDVMVLWFSKEPDRAEIAAMVVRGFTAAQGVELSKLAVEAGCSLRPDVAEVEGEQWILFESE